METYKYRIKNLDVVVTLKAKGPNSSGKIDYEGKYSDLAKIMLDGESGAFGHIFFPDSSTPIDLDYVLKSKFKDNVEVLGKEVESYDPEIPEGAVT